MRRIGGILQPVQESYEKQKQFITDASHEIKTPLAIIRADADVLELEQGESEWTGSNVLFPMPSVIP